MLTKTTDRASSRAVRAYDRLVLRAQFASLFWAAIMEKRRLGKFPLSALAKTLGKNKGEVSRWFSGNAPNWTVGTIAEVAYALDLEIRVEARDRITGRILTESGPKKSQPTVAASQADPGKFPTQIFPSLNDQLPTHVEIQKYTVRGVAA